MPPDHVLLLRTDLQNIVGLTSWILLSLAALGVIYSLATGVALGRLLRPPSPTAGPCPAVTILKPLHGDEPGLRERLSGFCDQDYPAAVQIVFGVRDPFDPALGPAREMVRDFPQVEVDIVIDPRVHGANLKISNLINMRPQVRHPVVVLADSDVSVGRDYLRRLVAELDDPKVGFVTCAFIGAPTKNVWSRFTAMSIDHHFLPSVALGIWLRMAKPCFGPTVALRTAVLDQVGGFARFADHLADDYEIGRAVRDLGYSFAVPSMLVGHACLESSARSVLKHELRWARTIRLVSPLSYAGSLICHPLALALAALALSRGAPVAWLVLTAVMIARTFVVARVARLTGSDASVWWLCPARDLLSFLVHVGGFLVRTVEWQGRRFRIGPGGSLSPVTPLDLAGAIERGWAPASPAAEAVVGLASEPAPLG